MRTRSLMANIGRTICPLAAVGALVVAPVGCGEGVPETGTKVEQPKEIQQANQNMMDFMKKPQQGKKK